jgi:ABC-type antimicrobial peptide transport system permease subunit
MDCLPYSVQQRRGEIGIRMALGCPKLEAGWLILREGLSLLGMGLAIGLVGTLAATRLLTGFLYDVSAIDPITFALVPGLLCVATLIGCPDPSCKAAAVDPMNALHQGEIRR